MARLLRDQDYLRVVQADNLAQIIESNEQIKLDVEQAAMAEMKSYLTQRYLVNQIFQDLKTFDVSASYTGKQLIQWTATAFSAATVYTTGQYVLQAGNIYKSIAGSAAHAFNVAEWTFKAVDKTLYYVTLPFSEFEMLRSYVVGDEVYYDNRLYTCLIASKGISPLNTSFWSAGASYTLTATYPDDASKWTQGDNRNQQIVLYLLDITLNHLHSRINPRNIPDLRKERYDGNNALQTGGAIGWLKRVSSGDITADLPQIMPQQGMSIRWGNSDGSTIKTSNQLW
jgi:hypothetical protein